MFCASKRFCTFLLPVLFGPMLLLGLYSALVFVPQESREGFGLLTTSHPVRICPRETICSEGAEQLVLIGLARISAYAMYFPIGMAMMSKAHTLLRWLSLTTMSTYFPFNLIHYLHVWSGMLFLVLATIHTIAHVIRWSLRHEPGLLGSDVGWSGVVGYVLLLFVTISMSLPAVLAPRCVPRFENRFAVHVSCTLLMGLVLLFHHNHVLSFVLSIFAVWIVDALTLRFGRTWNVDVVTWPLEDAGLVVLRWPNPPGLKSLVGEYVRIMVPGIGKQYHPFSVYDWDPVIDATILLDWEDDDQKDAQEHGLTMNHSSQITYSMVLISCRGGKDWCSALLRDAIARGVSSCWIRGPYIAPTSTALSHRLVFLIVSGVGITAALPVVQRYKKMKRQVFLIWLNNSAMLLQLVAKRLARCTAAFILFSTPQNKWQKAHEFMTSVPGYAGAPAADSGNAGAPAADSGAGIPGCAGAPAAVAATPRADSGAGVLPNAGPILATTNLNLQATSGAVHQSSRPEDVHLHLESSRLPSPFNLESNELKRLMRSGFRDVFLEMAELMEKPPPTPTDYSPYLTPVPSFTRESVPPSPPSSPLKVGGQTHPNIFLFRKSGRDETKNYDLRRIIFNVLWMTTSADENARQQSAGQTNDPTVSSTRYRSLSPQRRVYDFSPWKNEAALIEVCRPITNGEQGWLTDRIKEFTGKLGAKGASDIVFSLCAVHETDGNSVKELANHLSISVVEESFNW